MNYTENQNKKHPKIAKKDVAAIPYASFKQSFDETIKIASVTTLQTLIPYPFLFTNHYDIE